MCELRVAAAIKTLLVLALALRLHHHFHGPPIDYLGLAAASAASWVGLPGPGEPVLIAAGIFAAKGQLDLATVVAVAWASATAGGIAGWLFGVKAGRTLLTAKGPLWRARMRALERGEEVFERHPIAAIILTPSWVAGIHRVSTSTYMTVNVLSAVVWAVGIALGAYFAGPPIVDLVGDAGTVMEGGLVVLVALAVVAEIRRRRRRSAAGPAADRPATPS